MDSDKENEDESQFEHSDSQRTISRNEYKNILKELSLDEGIGNTQEDENLIKSLMAKADSLFSKIDTPQEALLDARVFKHLSRMCRQYAEGLSTSSKKFLVSEYAEFLAEHFGAAQDEETGNYKMNEDHWMQLGTEANFIMQPVPYLHYLYGSVDTEGFEPKVKEKRKRLTAAEKNGQLTKAKILGDEEMEGEPTNKKTLTEILVQSTFQQLVDEYRKNDKKPISYFRFVINGDCFGKSVENMFHVSFLVKEGKARIFVDTSNRLPKIEPIKKGQTQPEDLSAKKQVIVALSMSQWNSLKERLSIDGAQIHHDSQLYEQ